MRCTNATFFANEYVQAQGEPSEQFIRDLRKLAQSCNFGSLADSMIRDHIVYGTNNGKVREKLLRDNKLTLTKAEQVCKSAELSAAQNELWERERRVDALKLAPSFEPHVAQDQDDARAQERPSDGQVRVK